MNRKERINEIEMAIKEIEMEMEIKQLELKHLTKYSAPAIIKLVKETIKKEEI